MRPDVIWVATLNEDYQPPPAVSYAGIGLHSVPRVLGQLRELIHERDRTGASTPSILLMVDPGLDLGDLNRIVAECGGRLGVEICWAEFPRAEFPELAR